MGRLRQDLLPLCLRWRVGNDGGQVRAVSPSSDEACGDPAQMMSWRPQQECAKDCRRSCNQTQFQKEEEILSSASNCFISLQDTNFREKEINQSKSFIAKRSVPQFFFPFLYRINSSSERKMPPPFWLCSRFPVVLLLFSLPFKYNASQNHYDHLTF